MELWGPRSLFDLGFSCFVLKDRGVWWNLFIEHLRTKMARKKIREYDAKRLLKEHFKRFSGQDLPIKSVQVSSTLLNSCYCVGFAILLGLDSHVYYLAFCYLLVNNVVILFGLFPWMSKINMTWHDSANMYRIRSLYLISTCWSRWQEVWFPLSKVLDLSLVNGKHRRWESFAPLYGSTRLDSD